MHRSMWRFISDTCMQHIDLSVLCIQLLVSCKYISARDKVKALQEAFHAAMHARLWCAICCMSSGGFQVKAEGALAQDKQESKTEQHHMGSRVETFEVESCRVVVSFAFG